MQKRKDMFKSSVPPAPSNIVPSTVSFKLNRKAGRVEALSPVDKMKCALRKVLVKLSDDNDDGCRYYIDGSGIEVLAAPVAQPVREGEPSTYRAKGRCRLGVCHPEGHKSSKIIEFSLTFRDTEDAMGLADVDYIDPTTIDELPKTTRLSAA